MGKTPRLTGLKTLLSADLRSLAAFRVALGLILAVDTLLRWVDIRAHYTDFGVLPSAPFIEQFANPLHISLHLASGTIGWQIFLFTLTLVAALGVLFGYRTRLMAVSAWVLLVSVQNRNPMLLNGGDVLLRCLYFWAMFLPLGACYSVDAALSTSPPPKSLRYFSGGTVGVVLQVVFVYLATIMLKTGKEWFPEGTASYYALSLEEFTTPLGAWMKQWWTLLKYSTYGVYFLEGSVALFVLCPFYYVPVRLLLILALWGMHVSFALSMRLGIFPWVDMASLLPLIPSEVWDWISSRLKTEARLGLRLYFDKDCGFCRKMVLLIREFLLIPATEISPAQHSAEVHQLMQAERSWVVVDAEGGKHLRWDAMVTVFEHAPLLGLAAKALPLRSFSPLGDRAYKFVAHRRAAFGRITASLLPYRAQPEPRAGWLGTFLALFFVGYVALWNMKTIPSLGVQILEPWVRIASVLRLDQKWNMFAPYPLRESGWYVIPGELKDGTKVDVFRRLPGEPSEAKPALVSDDFPNARWRKYMMNLNERARKDYRLYYGKWLCRSWNESQPEEKKLARFELVFMRVKSVPPGEEGKPERLSLWQHDCFKRKSN